jgi:hypothetical protein
MENIRIIQAYVDKIDGCGMLTLEHFTQHKTMLKPPRKTDAQESFSLQTQIPRPE